VPGRKPVGDDADIDAYDIPTVCRRSKTGRSFVYEEIRSGRLIARKFGRLTRILRIDYDAWIAAAPSIAPMPPSERTAREPDPAPVLKPPSAPVNGGDHRRAKNASVTNRPGIGHNGGPALDQTNAARGRRVRSGAHR
jgi:hypothetical protein